MKKIALLLLVVVATPLCAQKIDKIVNEKSVKSIISTLASDDMNGRSSMDPASIGKATTFIESEFKSTGLDPLPGAAGYRQEFTIKQVIPAPAQVTINGEKALIHRR